MVKINDFINNALDIYIDKINITTCNKCKRPTEIIIVKHGFDKYLHHIWEIKQFCEFCYNEQFK